MENTSMLSSWRIYPRDTVFSCECSKNKQKHFRRIHFLPVKYRFYFFLMVFTTSCIKIFIFVLVLCAYYFLLLCVRLYILEVSQSFIMRGGSREQFEGGGTNICIYVSMYVCVCPYTYIMNICLFFKNLRGYEKEPHLLINETFNQKICSLDYKSALSHLSPIPLVLTQCHNGYAAMFLPASLYTAKL